jgi:two-component system LytT family response regulator
MLHAIIIDDELNGLRSMELLIKKFVPDIKIVALTTDPLEGIQMINNYRPDIVFLDIYMPNLNGFEVLEKLEFRNFHLLFTTAHQEFALKAIKQSATDYLLKPVDPEDLNRAIEKIKLKIRDRLELPDVFNILKELSDIQNLRIPVPTKIGVEYVTPKDILYIEAESNNSVVFLSSGSSINVTWPLKEYEALLCKNGMYFMRIHNSYVVNLNYVTRYLKEEGGSIVMNDKKAIPISKQKKEKFLDFINLKYE